MPSSWRTKTTTAFQLHDQIKLTIDNIIEMEIHSKQVQSLLQENQQLKSTIDQQRKELSIRDSVIQQLEGNIEMMIEKLSVHSI